MVQTFVERLVKFVWIAGLAATNDFVSVLSVLYGG